MVETTIRDGVDPSRIGYSSFTRKAVSVAIERVCAQTGLPRKALPHFGTLHSLAYRALGMRPSDVMGRTDWAQLSQILGVDLDIDTDGQADQGFLLPFGLGGARYVALCERAKLRQVSLEQEFSDAGDYQLKWPMVQQMDKALSRYCFDTGKRTFVRMLEDYLTQAVPPELELLIIDEAQDLSPLQWDVAAHMGSRAKRIFFAGDDDQAIHRWAGVDVARFIQSSENRVFLTQSYRMPKSVHHLTQQFVRRIPGRIEKDFLPTDREGQVSEVLDSTSLDLSSGSWTLMARTNAFVRSWAETLRKHGLFYEASGRPSIEVGVSSGIVTWRTLQAGGPVSLGAVRQLYETMPKRGSRFLKHGAKKLLDAFDPTAPVFYEDLHRNAGLIAQKNASAFDLLGLTEQEQEYVRAIERRGELIDKPPRIKLSTFHGMKGGEDDNVAVYLGTTRSCARSMYPEDEVRAFYVGMTRARERLFLVNSDRKERFQL